MEPRLTLCGICAAQRQSLSQQQQLLRAAAAARARPAPQAPQASLPPPRRPAPLQGVPGQGLMALAMIGTAADHSPRLWACYCRCRVPACLRQLMMQAAIGGAPAPRCYARRGLPARLRGSHLHSADKFAFKPQRHRTQAAAPSTRAGQDSAGQSNRAQLHATCSACVSAASPRRPSSTPWHA